MSGKIIIITTLLLLLVSFSALFAIEAKNHDPDYKKSWSVVYFENPRDDSLDFVIENHQGEKALYKYKILADDKKISENEVEIGKGVVQEIAPLVDMDKLGGNRITIVASYKDTDYKIYKNTK